MRTAIAAGMSWLPRWLIAAAAGLVLLAPSSAARAQDKVFYKTGKGGPLDVAYVLGKVVSESKAKIVIQTGGANREIPGENVDEIFYQLSANKAKAAANYKKAEDSLQVAAKAGNDARRKELLAETIKLFEALATEVADVKFVARHAQFKVAAISAQRAAGDRQLTLMAIELLEKFQKEHPDSWQFHRAAKLLGQLKPAG